MGFFNTIWKSSLSDLYAYIRNNNILGSFEKKMEVVDLKGPDAEGVKIQTVKSLREYQSIQIGEYESFLIEYIKNLKLSNKNLIIWDLGAHVGYLSILLANLFRNNAKIVSFEPNINNINNFKSNLSLNPQLTNIILEHSAVGATVGELTFNLSRSKNNPTTMGGFISTATPPLEQKLYKKMGFYSTKVPCTTIDDYLRRHSELKPDLLKIDVEGAELEVLYGGINFLKEHKPVLIIEVHHIILLYKVTELLKGLDYKIQLLNEEEASPSVCTIAATLSI